jgi:7-keto-8-aminopelargonate synthetase-like enzyme
MSEKAPSNELPSSGWTMEQAPAAETIVNGRRVLYFAGTGYLGLQAHQALAEVACEAVRQYGIHTATSRSGYGTSPPVREVEQRAAAFLGAEDAAYLVSGYATNSAVAAALAGHFDCVLMDEHAHDSLQESCGYLGTLAEPPLQFRHCDVDHLRSLLERASAAGRRALVLTDGVYAASGDVAPLADYAALLAQYKHAALLVDDAHGLGVLGQSGRGSLELAGVPADAVNRDLDEPVGGARIFHTATLSKAVGGHGGIIAGSRAFLDRVRRTSGWFRGSSAPAAPVAAATAKGLEIVANTPALRESLQKNVGYLRKALRDLGLNVAPSPSPIIGFQLATGAAMKQVHERLAAAGILIGLTRDYAGVGADGMLRIAVFATHTPEMLDRLIASLQAALHEVNAP